VQEALLTVWRQADRVDPARGSLSSFVLTVVHHKAIDALRARRGITMRQVSLDPAVLEKRGPDVTERVLQSIDRERVRVAIAALPDDQRQCVRLAYYEGLTHVEISERAGIPLGTVKSRIRLALDKLRATLGDEMSR
jgi:RNA polymerase sigma-70 factor (ECF subfamily)